MHLGVNNDTGTLIKPPGGVSLSVAADRPRARDVERNIWKRKLAIGAWNVQ